MFLQFTCHLIFCGCVYLYWANLIKTSRLAATSSKLFDAIPAKQREAWLRPHGAASQGLARESVEGVDADLLFDFSNCGSPSCADSCAKGFATKTNKVQLASKFSRKMSN